MRDAEHVDNNGSENCLGPSFQVLKFYLDYIFSSSFTTTMPLTMVRSARTKDGF